MAAELPKRYDSKEAEPRIQKFWEDEGVNKFDEKTNKEIYSIDTPPPTVSGKMHLGHAFSFSQQDFVARYKRMSGFEVYYPFGTDDNGLATEKLVQKKKKVNLRNVSRPDAIKICVDFLNEERPKFIQDWKNIGMSCDFSLCYSTIDDYSRKISQKSFLDLAKKGLVYRKEAPVIWDTQFQTAISQAELESVDKKTFFNDIIFKSEKGEELIIATTRPEMLSACVAVFAHPDDERYKKLFGKFALSPLYEEKVPILADEKADPEKGTGLVMCCTFGDQTDIEWYKKHNLPLKSAVNKFGKMTELGGKYAGMKVEEARAAIIEDLREAGLLNGQKEISHTVSVGERSGKPIEIINSKQWYVKYLDRKEDFLKKGAELNWFPEHMKHRLDNWIKGLNWDWCIARQRHFGVPIPVWYGEDGKVYYADESQLPVDPTKDRPLGISDDVKLIGEVDVFDTWFTSSSSPFLAVNLIEDEKVRKRLFPMNLRPQAHDIINFWLFSTMAKTNLLYDGTNPWEDATISGFVLDPKGNKMSKSKGNVVAPQDVIAKFSADAIRFWAATSKLGEDLPYQEKDVLTGQKFVNKMWNASKFALMNLGDGFGKDDAENVELVTEVFDKWLLARLQKVIAAATSSFEAYEYARAKAEAEYFFRSIFCDNYLEIVKDRLYNPDKRGEDARRSSQVALYHAVLGSLKMLAPIMPYITDEIYSHYFAKQEGLKSIHRSSWPELAEQWSFADEQEQAELVGDIGLDIIAAVRKFKSEQQLSLKAELSELVLVAPQGEEVQKIEGLEKLGGFEAAVKSMEADLKAVLKVEKISFSGKAGSVSEKFALGIGVSVKEAKES